MGWILLLPILIACPLITLFHWLLLLAFFASPLSSAPPPNDSMSQKLHPGPSSSFIQAHSFNNIYKLTVSQFVIPGTTCPLNSRFLKATAYLTHPLGHLLHISNLYAQNRTHFPPPQTCSYSASLSQSLLPHSPTCSVRKSSLCLLFP